MPIAAPTSWNAISSGSEAMANIPAVVACATHSATSQRRNRTDPGDLWKIKATNRAWVIQPSAFRAVNDIKAAVPPPAPKARPNQLLSECRPVTPITVAETTTVAR